MTVQTWTAPEAEVEIDLVAVRAAIARVSGQANELIRLMPSTDQGIPNSVWSVGEAAAHLVVVFRAFTDAVQGRLEYWESRYGEDDIRTWARLAEGNARTLAEVADRDNRGPWLDTCGRRYTPSSRPPPTAPPTRRSPRRGTAPIACECWAA